MKIIVTGSSGGIGTAVCRRFISLGHTVYGLDISPAAIKDENYVHFSVDVTDIDALPDIPDAEIIFNNAGVQNKNDVEVNLIGAVNVTEKYIKDNAALRSVLFNASASSLTGKEYPLYAASKAGLVGYMKNLAVRLAPRGITCNAISPGGVLTPLNDPLTRDPVLWDRIMAVTPMKKWMTAEEVADWVIFLTLTNRSMSGQNLLIDNGETDLADTFVRPE